MKILSKTGFIILLSIVMSCDKDKDSSETESGDFLWTCPETPPDDKILGHYREDYGGKPDKQWFEDGGTTFHMLWKCVYGMSVQLTWHRPDYLFNVPWIEDGMPVSENPWVAHPEWYTRCEDNIWNKDKKILEGPCQ